MKKEDIYYQKIDNPIWEGRLVSPGIPYNETYSKIKELAKEMGVSEEDFEVFNHNNPKK